MTGAARNLNEEIINLKVALAAVSAYVAALPGAAEARTLEQAKELVEHLTNPEADVLGGESVIAAREFIDVIFAAAKARAQ